jgi:preprotein translocase subunit SecA
MAIKWDDGESLETFIKQNKDSLVNFNTEKITSKDMKVTICEMVRRVIDTLVLNEVDVKNPEMFEELINRLQYIYISAKKMQNRIVQLNGSSEDLFEAIDGNYDISKRIDRVKKLR